MIRFVVQRRCRKNWCLCTYILVFIYKVDNSAVEGVKVAVSMAKSKSHSYVIAFTASKYPRVIG